MATEPSFVEKIYGTIWDPGGDPVAIRRAATANRALAGQLRAMSDAVNPAVAQLCATWTGEASAAFQRTSGSFGPAMADYVEQLNNAAESLENIAASIEEAQTQANNFKIMLGITIAFGVALTLFTFATSDVFAAGIIDAEATLLEIAIARLEALLAGEGEAFLAMGRSMLITAERFAYGLGLNIMAEGLTKGLLPILDPIPGQEPVNVFDPASYSAKDYTNLLFASVTTASLGALGGTKSIGGWLDNHPVLGIGIAGGASGSLSAVEQVWLNRNPPWSKEFLQNVGLTVAVSGIAGLVLGSVTSKISARSGAEGASAAPEFPVNSSSPSAVSGTPPKTQAVTKNDLLRGSATLPADAAEYLVNIPQDRLRTRIPTPAQAPRVVPPPPSTVPGQGGSLWKIARREYGDGSKYMLIAAANHIVDPNRIDSDQDLVIPPVPQAPN